VFPPGVPWEPRFWSGSGVYTKGGVSDNCLDWQSSAPSESGTSGLDNGGSDPAITWFASSYEFCNRPAHLLCLCVTNPPTMSPSKAPTMAAPSGSPTTSKPSISPSTSKPSAAPTTSVPSKHPTDSPSSAPSQFSQAYLFSSPLAVYGGNIGSRAQANVGLGAARNESSPLTTSSKQDMCATYAYVPFYEFKVPNPCVKYYAVRLQPPCLPRNQPREFR
jgi:hypothetical protein